MFFPRVILSNGAVLKQDFSLSEKLSYSLAPFTWGGQIYVSSNSFLVSLYRFFGESEITNIGCEVVCDLVNAPGKMAD